MVTKKKSGSGSEEAKKNIVNSKKSLSVAMAVIIASSVMTAAFMPLAAAQKVNITGFVITPADDTAGVTSAYTIQVNTTGFTSLNISLPAGFKAKTPFGRQLIAEVDLCWAPGRYGYVNFTADAANPSTMVDVYANISGDTAKLPGMTVNYTKGGTTLILSPFGARQERANLTLPTPSANGWLNISGLPDNITNVTVRIGAFVENPTNPMDYTFTVEEAVGKNITTVGIIPQPAVPVPEFTPIGLVTLVGIMSLVLVAAAMKKRK